MKNLDLMLIGLLGIIDGITALVTLGFWKSSLDMDYIEARTRAKIRRMRKAQKGTKNGSK